MSVSKRVEKRVKRDFGDRAAIEALSNLAKAKTGDQDVERIHAAIVLIAKGGGQRLWRAVQLSALGSNDVLVAGGLAEDDWPAVLEREFGPVS